MAPTHLDFDGCLDPSLPDLFTEAPLTQAQVSQNTTLESPSIDTSTSPKMVESQDIQNTHHTEYRMQES